MDELDAVAARLRVAPSTSLDGHSPASNGTAPSGTVKSNVIPLVLDVEVSGDLFNANRFLERFGNDVRYSPELGRWFIWNGAWWEEDRLNRIDDLARQTIEELRQWVMDVARGTDDFRTRVKHYTDSSRATRLRGLLDVAKTHHELIVSVDQLDTHPDLLACRNGTVELRTGELRPAHREDLITRGVDFEFDPTATAPEWNEFLACIFDNDEEMTDYVQRLAGYFATGETYEHLLPDLYGTGANGKSTFITVLMSVLGEHTATAPEGLLVERHHEQHPERLAALRGRRLVVSSELESRDVLSEGLVKLLTGGDRISTRQMYGQRFEFDPTHTIVIVTNKLPRVRGTDEAIWRRLRVVPFSVTIPPDERIPDYGKHLVQQHSEAILAWIVRGAVEWYEDGLTEPSRVRIATDKYRAAEDVFAQFLADCTVPAEGKRTPQKKLRDEWKSWADDQHIRPGRDQEFTEWLEAHGYEREDYQGAKFVRGLVLRSDREETM